MKKNLTIILIVFIWSFSVLRAETVKKEETMLRDFSHLVFNGEKIQKLDENYVCKEEVVDLLKSVNALLKSKYDVRFGFIEGYEKNLYYSKYLENKINNYAPVTSVVIKEGLYYEWFTYEINLVRHELHIEGYEPYKNYKEFIPIYNYVRKDYLLKEYQMRDLRILLRKVFEFDKIFSNKINLKETLMQQHKTAQEIFKSLEDKPIKTSKLYCTRTDVAKKQ